MKQAIWQINLLAPKHIPRPTFDVESLNVVYEADILFLPHDKATARSQKVFKYTSTVVDVEPTRMTETTKTLVDLSIISDRTKVVKAGVFDTCIADHRLIYTVLKLSKTRVPLVIRTVIDWKNCNQDTFKQQVAFIP